MKLKQIAADTRDPIASVVFSLKGVAGALGWIPEDLDANTLAEIVGLLMGAVAGVFSFVHHKDYKQAIHASLAAKDEARSALADVAADLEPGAPVAEVEDDTRPEGVSSE